MDVLFHLPEGVAVVAVSGRECRSVCRAGGQPYRTATVTVRYALPGGRLARARRRVQVAGEKVAVTGWVLDGTRLSVSLGRREEKGAEPCALADRFRVPLRRDCMGRTAFASAEVSLHAVCRGQNGSLRCSGTLRLDLGAERIAASFCRVVAAPHSNAWEGWAGVTALRLSAGEMALTGEAQVNLFVRTPPEAGPEQAPELKVRDARATVGRLEGEVIAPDSVLVRGVLVMDLFWFDADGTSRWDGGNRHFSLLLAVPGAVPGHRVDPHAAVLSLRHRPLKGQVHVTAVVQAGCLVVGREEMGVWLLERVVGRAAGEREVEAALGPGAAAPAGDARGLASVRMPPDGADRRVEMRRPPGWYDLSVSLEAPVLDSAGRWSVRVRTEADGSRGEATATGSLGKIPGAEAGRLIGLVSVSPTDLQLAAATWWPAAQSPAQPQAARSEPAAAGASTTGGQTIEALLHLPGPVRAILGAAAQPSAGGLLVEALVWLRQGALYRACGTVAAPAGRPAALLAAANGSALTVVVEIDRDGIGSHAKEPDATSSRTVDGGSARVIT